jgi:hypothetical protein
LIFAETILTGVALLRLPTPDEQSAMNINFSRTPKHTAPHSVPSYSIMIAFAGHSSAASINISSIVLGINGTGTAFALPSSSIEKTSGQVILHIVQPLHIFLLTLTFMATLLLLAYFFEFAFAHPALRTRPVFRQVVKMRPGRIHILPIAQSGIVHIAARPASVSIHIPPLSIYYFSPASSTPVIPHGVIRS